MPLSETKSLYIPCLSLCTVGNLENDMFPPYSHLNLRAVFIFLGTSGNFFFQRLLQNAKLCSYFSWIFGVWEQSGNLAKFKFPKFRFLHRLKYGVYGDGWEHGNLKFFKFPPSTGRV